MHASLIRRQLGGLVPPKIATPKLVVSVSSVLETIISPLMTWLLSPEVLVLASVPSWISTPNFQKVALYHA
jgi:hypothetical protein